VHAFLKTSRGMETHAALLAKNGITPLLAWPTFSVEVIGGVAILLGWYTRQWAAFLLVFLAVVVWIKWPVGWGYSNTGGGWEYPLFWLVAQAALVLAGSGAFSLQSGLGQTKDSAGR
jgi:putative oxidoreductase